MHTPCRLFVSFRYTRCVCVLSKFKLVTWALNFNIRSGEICFANVYRSHVNTWGQDWKPHQYAERRWIACRGFTLTIHLIHNNSFTFVVNRAVMPVNVRQSLNVNGAWDFFVSPEEVTSCCLLINLSFMKNETLLLNLFGEEINLHHV